MVREYINKYKEEVNRCIEDLKHKDTFYKQIPNLLTFSRLVGTIPINILYFTGNVIPAIILTGLILSTDFFDGKIARKFNVQSKFGADLDAVCDKFMFLGLSIPLIINNPILISNFILEGIISFINVLGRVKGLDTKTLFSGKIKTWFLSGSLVAGYLVQFFLINSSLLNILSYVTFGSQIITIDNYVKEYKKLKNEKNISKEDDLKELEEYEKEDYIRDKISELEYEKEFLLGMDYSKEENKLVKSKRKIKSRI